MARKIKTNPYNLEPHTDFSGGLNVDSAPDNLDDNQLEVLENFDLDYKGALIQRRGCVAVNTTAYADEVNQIIEWPRSNGTISIIAMIGNSLHLIDPATWEATLIKNLDNPDIGYFIFKNNFYFTGKEGTLDKFWVFGGTHQVETATVEGTVTTAGNATVIVTASGLTGSPKTYTVAVASSDSASVVGGKIRAALEADSVLTALYKVTGSGPSIILTSVGFATNDSTLNIDINNGTCAGLTDKPTSSNTTDGAPLLTEITPDTDASNDLTPIKRCRKFVWNYRNMRIYACKDPNDVSALYYSEANKPNFFKNTSKLYPTTGDGEVAELALFSTALLTIYDNSIWAWQGSDPAVDATWEKLPITHGTTAQGSVCATPSSLTMVSEGGLHALNPAVLDKEIMLLSNEEISINMAENRVMNILKSIVHPETVRSAYDTVNRRYLMAYGDDASNPKNNKILVLSWPLKSFSIYTGITVNDIIRRRSGEILVASGSYILRMNTGLNDIDTMTGEAKPIYAKVRSKQLGLQSTLNMKKVNKMFLGTMQYIEGDSTVDLGVISGYKSLLYRDVLLNEAFIWGTEWGRVWGWSDVIGKEVRCRLKGQRFQFVCEHNKLNEPLTILGVAFNFKYKKPKGVKISVKAQKNVLS